MIDVRPDQMATIRGILGRLVPEAEVRAFGSRATWTAKDYSDLDLAIVGKDRLPSKTLGAVRDAFEESDLSFRVDVLDWHAIGAEFRKVIDEGYEVVQKGKQKSLGMAGDAWTEHTVDEIKSSAPNALATGPFRSAISSQYFVDHGVPVIRGGNLSQDVGIRLIDDGLVFVSDEKAREFSRSLAKRGDLVFTCWGTIDQVGLIDDRSRFPEYVVSNKQMKLTPDPEKASSLFLYYLFSSPLMRERILNQGIGSSVPGFNLGQLRSITLNLPPPPEQRAIAHILGTLDDKIELNRRMNETLEAIARALFKSWFVDFDPVRAKAEGRDSGLPQPLADLFPDRFEDSELGEIPNGWRVGTLGDVAEHPRRGVQPNAIHASTPYIALEHMPKRCIALSEWGIADGLESNKFEFRKGEILFGKLRPYFHKVGVAPVDGVCSTDIVVVTPRAQEWFGFVLGHVSSDAFVEHTNAGSTGTRMPRTSWGDMARHTLVLPPGPIMQAFTTQIRASVTRLLASIHESRTLAALRDTLLPKLISGEVRLQDVSL